METTQTWIELGNLYQKLNLADKAVEVYESVYKNGDSDEYLLTTLFDAYVLAGRLDSAIYLSESLIKISSDSIEKAKIYFNVGKLCMQKNDPKLALAHFNKALELDSSLSLQIAEFAEEMQQVKNNQEVSVVAMPEGEPQILCDELNDNQAGIQLTMSLTMGIMHWRNGKLEEAEETLCQVIEDSKKSANTWVEALAWHSLALVKTAFGDVKGAIDAYVKAAELAPNQIFPWNKVGALYENLDMNDEAQNAYKKSLILNPEDAESWNGMGDLLTKHGKLDEAISCYQLGNVFESHSYGNDGIKVYEKALEYYKKTIGEIKNDSKVFEHPSPASTALVEETVQQVTLTGQNELIEGSSELIPDDKLANTVSMIDLQNQVHVNDRAENVVIDESILSSIRKFEQTVKENPFNDRAWDSLGNLYKMSKMYEKAIFAYENAVAIQPRKHLYHYQLGSLYAAYGNFNVAISEMLKVLEQDPTSTYAHCALANYFRRLGFQEKANYHIEFVIPFMKNEKEYDRACFESVRGEVDLALELLEKALEKKQTSIELVNTDMDLDFIRSDPRFEKLEMKFQTAV